MCNSKKALNSFHLSRVKAHQNNEQLRAEQIKFVNMNENWGNDKWVQNYWLHNNWPIDSWLNHNWASDNWVNEQMALEQMTTKSLSKLIEFMQIETFQSKVKPNDNNWA